jgi:hypothetical protein
MIYFVYTAISPVSNFFILGCFLIENVCYLHQFVYIYPPFPDSGGRLWIKFIGFVPWGMLISQVTIIGMLSLKRVPEYALAMLPLLVLTVLFSYYVHQEHFRLAMLLSVKECVKTDAQHEGGIDLGFLRVKYLQPELGERHALPRNLNTFIEMQIDTVREPLTARWLDNTQSGD